MKAFRMSACLLAAALLSASLCAAQTFTGKAQSWVRGEFRGRGVAPDYLRVDVALADAPRDQLRVLRPVVEYDYSLAHLAGLPKSIMPSLPSL